MARPSRPGETLVRSNPQNSSPERGFTLKTIQVSSRPRLGDCLSPERETKSLNPIQGRLGE